MTPKEKNEQQELIDLLSDASLHLAFGWRREPDNWRVEIAPTMTQLEDRLLELALNTAADLHDSRAEVVYSPGAPLNETEFYGIENSITGDPPSAPIGGNLLPQVDDFGQLDLFGTGPQRANPQLYVVIAQLSDGSIAKFGRRVTARHLLKKSRWIRALWTGETFDLLDEGPLLALDPFIDWISWRDYVLIVDAEGFHRTFRTVPQLLQAVRGHVDTLTSNVSIKNAAEFVARCQTTPAMASKLESVIEQKLYEKPLAELKDYSQRYPKLGVQWDGDELVFDGDLKHQWNILRLFDEAGYTGELSGEQFEAAAKRPLG
ncbi:MAG TPA: Kiwa anti-phage protein KwaB-like domain-containing protein [Solirubrobacterales bacterium]|nr:Kiwa anti-phage protein KwaB-like domain-containing protein [Solirubrobacterales bacterium]